MDGFEGVLGMTVAAKPLRHAGVGDVPHGVAQVVSDGTGSMSPATAAHRSAVRARLGMARIGWANVGVSVTLAANGGR